MCMQRAACVDHGSSSGVKEESKARRHEMGRGKGLAG